MRTRRITTNPKIYKQRRLVEWNNLPTEVLLTATDYLSVSNKLMLASTCSFFRSMLIPNMPSIGGIYISSRVHRALQPMKPGIVITDNIALVILYLKVAKTLYCDKLNWSKSHDRDYSKYQRVVILDGEELLLSEVPIDPYNNIVSQCSDTYILLQADIYDKQIECPVSYIYFRDYIPKPTFDKLLLDANSPYSLMLQMVDERMSVFLALGTLQINTKKNEAIVMHDRIKHGKSTINNLSQLGRIACNNMLDKLIVCKYIEDLNELKCILSIRCKKLAFIVYDRGNYISGLKQLINITLECR